MIRKHIVKQLRVTRTPIGKWWKIDLLQDSNVKNPPRPIDCIPFQMDRPVAGFDNKGQVYSRTDMGEKAEVDE